MDAQRMGLEKLILNVEKFKPNDPNAPTKMEIIKNSLGNLLDSIHKFGITITAAAPFSSRGLFLN